jgi:deoxyribodipyrimidine photo-lyase
MPHPSIHWFRRDLRLSDNPALVDAATRAAGLVIPVFVVDPTVVRSSRVGANRLAFMYARLHTLDAELRAAGSGLVVLHGDPATVLPEYAREHAVAAVCWQRDETPWATQRDQRVAAQLQALGIAVGIHDGQLLVPTDRIRSGGGTPYTVFTPFYRRWRDALRLPDAIATPSLVAHPEVQRMPAIPAAPATVVQIPDTSSAYAHSLRTRFATRRIDAYQRGRDMLAVAGTSMLSPYLRFGIVSMQSCARIAVAAEQQSEVADGRTGAEVWLSELAWRDFYMHICVHFPHVLRGSFRPMYDAIAWENDETQFAAWCSGTTGYPIVDAAMRQLTTTGWMHNRARMIVASFLTKDLLIDWRWGERFFMQHLLDGDTPANNGGWQWAAGTGTDAQPYFRIFNPSSQGTRFDPDGLYVQKYLPALAKVPIKYIHTPWLMPLPVQRISGVIIGTGYPAPIVDHATQRVRALALYATVRGQTEHKNLDD